MVLWALSIFPFPFFPVQLRGKTARSEGQLHEEAAGRDDDQDGRPGKGIHEG